MDQLVRRINALHKLKLSETEIQQIAQEAIATEEVLRPLYAVDLGQTRPIMGIVKRPINKKLKRGAK